MLVVHGLVEEVVVQGLLVEVVQGVEHEVLVQAVAGVQVQVLQLLVTIGLPAVVISKVLQCLGGCACGIPFLTDDSEPDQTRLICVGGGLALTL